MNGVKALRKAIKKARVDEFEVGTVIRWTAAGRYTYVVIKTPVGWYSTARPGNVFVPSILEFDELVEILSKAETSNVEIATSWETV